MVSGENGQARRVRLNRLLIIGMFLNYEKRLLTRQGNNLTLYDPLYGTDGYGVLTMDLAFQEYKNGFSLGKRNYAASGNTLPSAPPIAHVRLQYNDADRQYYPDTSTPLANAATLMNVQHFIPHAIYDSGSFYISRQSPLYFDYSHNPPVEVLAFSGNQVYNLKLYWGINTDTYRYASYSRPSFSQFLWPNIWTWGSLFNGGNWETEFNLNTAGQLNGQGTTDSTYYARGVTFNLGDSVSGTAQRNYSLRMMLGKTSTQKVNAGYIVTSGSSQTYDFSSTDDSGQIKVKLARAQLSQPLWTDKSTDGGRAQRNYVPTTDIELTLNLPLWPTLKMQDINSNYFRYENQPLKKGSGLPIVKNVPDNGDLHISAKYETARIVSAYSSKGITVDVANDTFTTDDWRYLKGYEGNVDSEQTAATIKELKDIKFNNTEKKLELTIPVKKEDNVWLRIAPDTTDGGYYAKLSDLKVTLQSY